jgi:hypothetical protein
MLLVILFFGLASSVTLHDPRHIRLAPSDFEPIVYRTKYKSLLELTSQPSPQIEAPGRLECDCLFTEAEPLGRPDSEYHEGHLISQINQPSTLKLKRLSNAIRNPNSKVEDTVSDLLSANA